MSTLRFNDGVEIDTEGPIRKRRIRGEWFVVGNGMCIPCSDEAEADEIIVEMEAEATR